MSGAVAIYDLERILQSQLTKLSSDLNGKILLKYYQSRVADGISVARIVKCLIALRKISSILGKEFEAASKDDLVELIARTERLKVSDATKRDYKVILKKFYQWLKNFESGEYPPEVKWIKSGRKQHRKLTKGQLLTTAEAERLVNAAANIRDKALLLVLIESGRRIGDILPLKIEHVDFDDMGARLLVDGKSGADHSRIISSASTLAIWLDNHPLRNDSKAPVWISLEGKNRCKQLSYNAARKILDNCVKKAGLNKRIYFHLFRHTRATQAATKLNQMQMCAMLGWKFSSNMPSIYVHLAGEDIDEAQAIMNGVENHKDTEMELQPKECSRCKERNSPVSKFCVKCGAPLDLSTAIEADENRSKVERLMNKLAEDPEKLARLLALVEE